MGLLSARPICARIGGLVVTVGLLTAASGAADRPKSPPAPIRLVLSSLAPAAAATRLSSKSLYSANDPWKQYLASERTCPGGERTDLPLATQSATVACLVNFARARRGLRTLRVTAILDSASSRKTRAILRCAKFAHDPCGGDWRASLRSTGYVGSAGENLYLASGPFGAPRVAVDAWLNSPAHRDNLFRPEWREQGLAVAVLRRFEGYEDVALWVSVLGDRKPS